MYIDIQELAGKLAVSVSTIRTWVRIGHLDHSAYFKAGNTYRFNFDAVLNCLHGQPSKPSELLLRTEKTAQALEVEKNGISNVEPDLDQRMAHDAEADFPTLAKELIHPDEIDANAELKNENSKPTKSNILNTTKKHVAIRLAQKMSKEGQFNRARIIFEDILEKFPKNQRALQGLTLLPDDITGNEPEEVIDDSTYVGDQKNGEAHGQGSYTQADGTKYVGLFQDGLRHGHGTYTWPDGSQYIGEWLDDEENGPGIFTQSDGEVFEGFWENGDFQYSEELSSAEDKDDIEEANYLMDELDILRAEYQFLVLELSKLIQAQSNSYQNFFEDIFPVKDVSELEDLGETLRSFEQLQDFKVLEKLENYTKKLVHELYQIKYFTVPEQEQPLEEAFKVAGYLKEIHAESSVSDFLSEVKYFASLKSVTEKSFLESFEKKIDKVSADSLKQLGLLLGSLFDGRDLHSLAKQNYPKDVDVDKVIQLRKQIFEFKNPK